MSLEEDFMLAYAGSITAILLVVANDPENFSNVSTGIGLTAVAIPSALMVSMIARHPLARESKWARVVAGLSLIVSVLSGVIAISLLFWKLSFWFSILFPAVSFVCLFVFPRLLIRPNVSTPNGVQPVDDPTNQ